MRVIVIKSDPGVLDTPAGVKLIVSSPKDDETLHRWFRRVMSEAGYKLVEADAKG